MNIQDKLCSYEDDDISKKRYWSTVGFLHYVSVKYSDVSE